MQFGEKLFELRREKGYSQEQLADLLNISRQAISKWEAGSAMPEIEKLISVSDLFGVSVDYLIRDNATKKEEDKTVVTVSDNSTVMHELAEIKSTIENKQKSNIRYGYEYKSKTKLFGIPLVHINHLNHGVRVAKGIIAIGDVAVGIVSIGGISIGALSLGGLSFGLLFAMGGLALGGVAFGGCAIGVYAFGGCSIAIQAAIGGFAAARVAVGDAISGEYTLQITRDISASNIYAFIMEHL